MTALKPLHGWRQFVGEVGVIVLGVLLALVAQQAAGAIQIRADVKAFRQTIDREIALNLWIYDRRDAQFACIKRRVAQLDQLMGNYREGSTVALADATYPRTFSPYSSAWDNRDGQIFEHLPAATRQKYAEFYDELANNELMRNREREGWMALVPYEQAGPLSIDDRRKLHSLSRALDRFNVAQKGNIEGSREIARALDIHPRKPDVIKPDDILDTQTCRTLVRQPGA